MSLHDKIQCEVIESCFSSLCASVSGVPQGSVQGHLLYLIFINSIETVRQGDSTLQLFADDATLYSCIDLNSQFNSQQSSLNCSSAWADQWQLTVNISKCSVLNIAPKTHQASSNYFNYGAHCSYTFLQL